MRPATSAWRPAQSGAALVKRARPLLGTFVEVTVQALEPGKAVAAAFAAIEEVQRRMSFHDPASGLSALNRRAFREPVAVDAWTFAVLTKAREIWEISDRVFDVTGRGGATFADVELRPDQRVRFHHPAVRIDLGGIAKGFAVDQAIKVLRECGVTRALVNAGGDLRALGSFPISVRHPQDPGQALATVRLANAALATSAHYFANRFKPGAQLAPIFDPRTGAPAAHTQSATVRARNALLADALTKVVMLRGEAALPVLEHFAADAFFVATVGSLRCSPGWHAALDFPA